MLPNKNILETNIDEWPDNWDELSNKLVPLEVNDKHFWKNLVTSKITATPLDEDTEAEYKAFFETFWLEIRPQIINNPDGLIMAADNGLEIYIKNWLKQLPPEKSKALVNHHTKNADTALHVAAKYGDLELTKTLIEYGADVNAVGFFSQTPLHYAAHHNFPELITYLLKSGAANDKSRSDTLMPIHVAVDMGRVEAVKAFLNHDPKQLKSCAKEARTPMYLAAMNGNTEMMKVLIANGDNINQFNPYNRHTLMHLAVIKNNLKLLDFLITNNMDANALDGSKFTPLQCAAMQKKPSAEIAMALIKAGADVNAGNPSPYYLLADNVGDNTELGKDFAHALIQHGAIINPSFETPFDLNKKSYS